MRLYEESTTTYALALGKDAALVGVELIKLGRAQALCGELALAHQTYTRGLDIVRRHFGPDGAPVAEGLTCLGALLVQRLELDAAVAALQEALRIRRLADPQDPQLAYLYQKTAEACAMKREPQAEAYFLLAIEAYHTNAKTEPVQRTYASDVLDDLGLFYVDFQHYDKAERCFKQALDLRLELLGDHHATVAYSYSNFALLYLLREALEDCERMARAALELYAKTARTNTLAQADVYTVLGQCLHKKKAHAAALESLEKALNHRRLHGESAEQAVAESLNYIARVLLAMRRVGRAAAHVREARRIAFRLNQLLTEALRAEIEKTERMLPPLEEWTAADHAEAGDPPSPLPDPNAEAPKEASEKESPGPPG
ncbi:unnamed protein product [Phytomonas sp. Hart1]|nr:unnamed protein product [Phytomonas sp. Hart1]|eukprot:CCW71907.1 unnamed protein product [Phytomonas sp. isolate Hart1]